MNKAITRTCFIAGYLPAKDNFRAIERKEVRGAAKLSHMFKTFPGNLEMRGFENLKMRIVAEPHFQICLASN